MAAPEERLEILRMIQAGQITAEEGARLLEALAAKDRPQATEEVQSGDQVKEAHLRIRVDAERRQEEGRPASQARRMPRP